MKLTFFTTLALLLLNLNLMAADTEPKIVKTGNKSFTVDVTGWSADQVRVRILDLKNNLIISDQLKNATGRIYNLKRLESGAYTVTIENEFKKIERRIEILNEEIFLLDKKTIFKPNVSVTDRYIDVNTLTQKDAVEVKIYQDEILILDKTYTGLSSVNQRFDITQLPVGNYAVVVSNLGESTRKSFRK